MKGNNFIVNLTVQNQGHFFPIAVDDRAIKIASKVQQDASKGREIVDNFTKSLKEQLNEAMRMLRIFLVVVVILAFFFAFFLSLMVLLCITLTFNGSRGLFCLY